MKRLFQLLIIPLSILSATIINVPEEYSTIQEGVNESIDGDTVLVADGMYYENLSINKDITLASHFIIDGDLSHRDATIIDGSNYDEDSGPFGSCVLFLPPENGDHIHPRLAGFTIQNGRGTRVREAIGDSTSITYFTGGGLTIWHSFPEVTYNYIIENGSNSDIRSGPTRGGGGAALIFDDNDVEFDEDRNESYSRTVHSRDDEIIFSNNIFENNDSDIAKTFESRGYEGNLDLSNSFFDVFSSEYENISEYWVKSGDANINLTGSSGELEAITNDVWVSTDGQNNISTTGTELDPFKTIDYALSRIYSTENGPITIHILDGTYAPSTTGEVFPIRLISNVNLIGQSRETTILNREIQSGTESSFYPLKYTLLIEDCDNNVISNLTITGGDAAFGHFFSRNTIFSNLTINENNTGYFGGNLVQSMFNNVIISENGRAGMYLSNYEDIIMSNVIVSENGSYGMGSYGMLLSNGDLLFHQGDIKLSNIIISGNGNVGMYLFNASPSMNNVIISGNNGPGMRIKEDSHPTLTNVTITGNGSYGMLFGNSGTFYYDNDYLGYRKSNATIKNSIIWGNFQESIRFNTNYPSMVIIQYSDIEGGEEGIIKNDNGEVNWLTGNIDANPHFRNPENGDFTLREGSPCINSSSPDFWYQDMDGTTGDMGVTGGLFVIPNFISHDFGEVGDIIMNKQFSLFNGRETAITINSVSFNTSVFESNSSFPITIEPLQYGFINIAANNSVIGDIEDEMVLISNDLPEGISVSLSLTAGEGNILSGELSGTYTGIDYQVVGDLTVPDGNTLYLSAGTKFLFDGLFDFKIFGTLKAIGTETDSIIFENYGEEKWKGLEFISASNETELRYVRVSGSEDEDIHGGGGMLIANSDITLSHSTVVGNKGPGNGDSGGGGIRLSNSDVTMTHVNIIGNTARYGGGISMTFSSPTMTHVNIIGNTAIYGGGISSWFGNPVIEDAIISDNTSVLDGGGIRFYMIRGLLMNDVTISGNTSEYRGGGLYLEDSDSDNILNNVTISGNTATCNAIGGAAWGGGRGGGIFMWRGSLSLNNVNISENTATCDTSGNSVGGGIYMNSSSLSLNNVDISDNTANVVGGLLSYTGGTTEKKPFTK